MRRLGHSLANNVRVTLFWRAGVLLLSVRLLCSQPGPPYPPQPGPLDSRHVADHLADVRNNLERTNAVNATARRALEYSRSYLGRAQNALRSNRPFVADRFVGAADALRHVAEHQEHLRVTGGPKGPPPPPDLQRHLERVYFRLQQADYFLAEAHDPVAASFPKWARDFYQLAVSASGRNDPVAADENAKCAEEVVKALENLAQAATGQPGPPSPPPPPPGARP